MDELAQTIVFALSTGGVIAVAAVGLTLSYGVTGFINFAYGELLTVSAFVTYAVVGAGVSRVSAALAGVVAAAVMSIIVAVVFYEPLRARGVLPLLITSVGVAFIAQNGIQIAFGASPVPFPIPLLRPFSVGSVFIPKVQAAILVISLAAMLSVHLLLTFTQLGKKMRATAANDDLARLSGINTRDVVRMTWVVTGVVAGVAGALLGAAQATIRPTLGFSFLLVVFAATLLGGIGRPYGAMAGAVLMGFGIEFGATYISSQYSYAIAFAILVLVLLIRPSGLWGRADLSPGGA